MPEHEISDPHEMKFCRRLNSNYDLAHLVINDHTFCLLSHFSFQDETGKILQNLQVLPFDQQV